MGFITFRSHNTDANVVRCTLPRNAVHTPRRIPLISSRTTSLWPLPSCCYFAPYMQPATEVVDRHYNKRGLLCACCQHVVPTSNDARPTYSKPNHQNDNPTPLLTTVCCGYRTPNDEASTRKSTPNSHPKAQARFAASYRYRSSTSLHIEMCTSNCYLAVVESYCVKIHGTRCPIAAVKVVPKHSLSFHINAETFMFPPQTLVETSIQSSFQ